MRLLVLSDTHAQESGAVSALAAQPNARHVFFLGDGLRGFEELAGAYPDHVFYTVKGNCDFGADYIAEGFVELAGVKIFFTHGHLYGVKFGLESLCGAALKHGAELVLFGHTHRALSAYSGGLYLLNPGSLSRPASGSPSYGTADLTPAGIVTNVIELK